MPEYTLTLTPDDSLQAAIDSLPSDPALHVHIRLTPGVWREKITLARPNTTLEGAGSEETTILWQDAATDPMDDIGHRGTFRTATLRTDGANITLRKLHIRNAAAPREKAGQAIALYADGDLFLCEDCRLSGAQDTLFTAPLPPKEVQPNGFVGPKQFAPRVRQRQTYRRCRIEGDVDFIFGGAAAWFEDCDIVSVGSGFATAASTPEGQRFGYIFDRCRFLSEGCGPQTVHLGRPWREFARTVLLRCELGAHIRSEGWDDWGKKQFPETGFYAEYACFGPGAQGERAPFAHRLAPEEAAQYTHEAFLATEP